MIDDDELKKLTELDENILLEKVPQRAIEIFRTSKGVLRQDFNFYSFAVSLNAE